MRDHYLYPTWTNMKQRCQNKKHPAYKYYGGRGIEVCERWSSSFANFLADMGDRPDGLTLERRNNNWHYSPENCYWATRSEQNKNQNKKSRRKYGNYDFSMIIEDFSFL